MVYDLIIIGGGASGLFGAVCASLLDNKLKIAVLEKNNRVGKKILMTGNGRCNLTNQNIDVSFYNSDSVEFLNTVLTKFGLNDTLEMFKSLGVLTVNENDKIFPMSLQASSIVDVLRFKIQELGVDLITEFDVKNITKKSNLFYINSYNGKTLASKKVIVATGGKAAPSTGSTGDGYIIAGDFGHKCTKLYPSLVQLVCDKNKVLALKGVKFNGSAELYVDGSAVLKEFGEILFTDYGVSGPPIFQLSGKASVCIDNAKKVSIKLDLCPEISYEELFDHLIKRNKNIVVDEFLTGLFNKQICKMLLKQSGLEKFGVSATKLTTLQLETIAKTAKNWELEITGTKSWNNAQVTIGGILTNEITPDTLESKLVKGLYFAGEIINVDGKCGGYNLQWAWSSGAVAAKSAVEEIIREETKA